MADVKTAIKNASLPRPSRPANNVPPPGQARKQFYFDKLYDAAVKALRNKIDEFAENESKIICSENDLEMLKPSRLALAEQLLSYAKNNDKRSAYLTNKDIKELTTKILKHINFMLPSAAFYSEQLQQIQENEMSEKQPITVLAKPLTKKSAEVVQATVQTTTQAAAPILATTPPTKPKNLTEQQTNNTDLQTGTLPQTHVLQPHTQQQQDDSIDNPAILLAGKNAESQIHWLQQLDMLQLQQLQENIQQAIIQKTEKNIEQVVALIEQNDLPIDVILQKLAERNIQPAKLED
ncbi:hypothetical protein DC094_07315 [Pelagibaculum spongiae]|uniref:Uncharacterized protein n=2 Tax=Pelagibaculum spongiae TaxID=2080658 RepID=A0A2V1GZM2_9GAMM|nr:hypothetical protein DC094_07315 [Pelagibaculum spongiae]